MSRPLNDDVFRAVAHPVRRTILEMLRKRDHTPGEIATAIPTSSATLSHHLRVLRQTRMVAQRRNGPGRMYRLEPRAMRMVQQWSSRF